MADKIPYDFDGMGVTNPTPSGGSVQIAVGRLVSPDGTNPDIEAIGIRITDQHGDKVAEFAMVSETFEVFLDTMMQVYNMKFGDVHDSRENDPQQPDKS